MIYHNNIAALRIVRLPAITGMYSVQEQVKTFGMAHNFEKYTQEANKFVKQLAYALGTPDDTDHAIRVTEAFFHTLRERITPEESMHLVAQLPMYLKAIYVNGWKIGSELKKYETKEAFIASLKFHTTRTAGVDFGSSDEEAELVVNAVVNTLKMYVDEGELNNIIAQLPFEIAAFLAQYP